MSYAEQIGDKFYWMNPPDAREGDEHLSASNEWVMLSLNDAKLCHLEPLCETRRLIAPGGGWRILGVEETPTPDAAGFLSCFVRGEWIDNYFNVITRCSKYIPVNKLSSENPEIIAIRQRISVEPGKDDEWPRYWLHDGQLYRESASKVKPTPEQYSYVDRWHSGEQCWDAIGWQTWDAIKPLASQRLTPAEAHVLCPPSVLQQLYDKVKERGLFDNQVADGWPEHSELRFYHLGAANRCLEIQRWIEEAMQKRKS